MTRARHRYTVILTSKNSPGKVSITKVESWSLDDAFYDATLEAFDKEELDNPAYDLSNYEAHGIAEGWVDFQ